MTPFFLSESMKLVTVASNSLVNKIEGNLILKHAMVKNYKSKKYGLKIRLFEGIRLWPLFTFSFYIICFTNT